MKSFNKTTLLLTTAIILVAGCIILSLYYGLTLYVSYQQNIANQADLDSISLPEPIPEKTFEEKKTLLEAMMAAQSAPTEEEVAANTAKREVLEKMITDETPYTEEEILVRRQKLEAMMAQ
jgi:hypothetical protein